MSILLTNTSISNFTLDDTLLSRPDLYLSSSIALHGIASLPDYSVYGAARGRAPFTSLPPPSRWDFRVAGSCGRTSGGGCFCREFAVVLKWVTIFWFICSVGQCCDDMQMMMTTMKRALKWVMEFRVFCWLNQCFLFVN
ncbi:uncharacterized protein LOC110807385 [Carica papaya]|uniref:uncharacterized protein LOC110807385 n=1 Tax=Carica papaya TaxID=3649 RepID=UPI000B8CD6D2|nr:uncharacterized protein LOC110807385 [Carica papaya]